MKKLFLAFFTATAILSVAACTSVGDEAVEKYQEMYKAVENKDKAKFINLAKEFDSWYKGLSEDEKKEAEKAVMAWDKEKVEKVEMAADEVADEL